MLTFTPSTFLYCPPIVSPLCSSKQFYSYLICACVISHSCVKPKNHKERKHICPSEKGLICQFFFLKMAQLPFAVTAQNIPPCVHQIFLIHSSAQTPRVTPSFSHLCTKHGCVALSVVCCYLFGVLVSLCDVLVSLWCVGVSVVCWCLCVCVLASLCVLVSLWYGAISVVCWLGIPWVDS